MSVRPIVTPMPEVVDRYTIAMLKIERLSQDEIDVKDMQRQIDYYKTGIDFSNVELRKLVEALYDINGKMWDAEHAIRAGQDEDLGLMEIGKRALHIRDLNRTRMKVKNDIIELTGDGFKDCKMNYARF
jgi:hypothetical protein